MNRMSSSAWLQRDMIAAWKHGVAFTHSLPRVMRIRRRGFPSRVRQGNQVRHAGKTWTVTRRSNWNLWLYEYVEMVGNTVTIKLPKRFAGKKEKAIA